MIYLQLLILGCKWRQDEQFVDTCQHGVLGMGRHGPVRLETKAFIGLSEAD